MLRPVRALKLTLIVLLVPALLYAQESAKLALSQENKSDRSKFADLQTKAAENIPAQRLFVRSDTVYMKTDTIKAALERLQEFKAMNLQFADSRWNADYFIEIKRPFLTWDWTYTIVDPKANKPVASGKVTSITAERAARGLAPLVLKSIWNPDVATRQTLPAAMSLQEQSRPKNKSSYTPEARDKITNAKVMLLSSKTVWMYEEDLNKAMAARPEFAGWGFTIKNEGYSEDVTPCDLQVHVHRPVFTYTWVYELIDCGTKTTYGTGKVSAIAGPQAAPKLAKEISREIAFIRGYPPEMANKIAAVLAEPNARKWQIRHAGGEGQIKQGTKITFGIGSKTIFAQKDDDILFSIAGSDLREVGYVTNATDRSAKWMQSMDKTANFMFSGVSDENALGALFIALPMWGIQEGVGALLKGSNTTEHYVLLQWTQGGILSETRLKMDEKQAMEILNELERFTTRKAVDWAAQAQSTKKRLLEAYGNKGTVEIDRFVALGFDRLAPKIYEVVVIPHEPTAASGDAVAQPTTTQSAIVEVYFLTGNPRENRNVAARVPGRVVATNTGAAKNGVEYSTRNDTVTIQQLEIGGQRIVLDGIPMVPETIEVQDDGEIKT